ncbi:MAG: hypothetical protein ACOCZ5_00250 [bacterium]
MSKNNLFKYSNLDVNEIMSQITDRISSDTRFDNFRESSVAETLLEIFAGVVDINNYYIQRRAEENFFDTAQLRSSIIGLARQLGYVPSRPSPAYANLRITLSGDFSNIFENNTDNRIVIPYYSKFNYDGDDFVLKQTLSYRIPENVLQSMNEDGEDFEFSFTQDSFGNPIELVEGKIKEKIILGNNNSQIGSIFQIYKINDVEFSNLYGDKDTFYNNVTRVYVGENKTEDTRYSIDRRSLINWESFDRDLNTDEASKVCVIRTAQDETVELLFGDGRFADLGPRTRKDNVFIQYLATKGSEVNRIGVIGEEVDFSGKVFTPHGEDITDMVTFELNTNIIGGTDFESSDSIKYSAPKIYYSLDRLVAKRDYEAYLKSLKSPISVRNAVVWGEQEQTKRIGSFADVKSFNVAFFTLIGSLYNTQEEVGGVYSLKAIGPELDSAILDTDFDPDGINDQSYFNVYSRQRMAQQLKMYNVKETYNTFYGEEFEEDERKTLTRLKQVGPDQKLVIEFGSDNDNYSKNIIDKVSIDIDLDNIGNFTELKNEIKTLLESVIDNRSVSTENENFGSLAFDIDTVDVEIDEDDKLKRVIIKLAENSPCYVKSILDTTVIDGNEISNDETEFIQNIGLTSGQREIESKTQQDKVINNKIVQVVNDLDSRSQIVVRNIYVSPTIQTFNLVGDVYIKSLYDIEEYKTDITNAIYEWLDQNADFNVPIHISNIIDIIENFSGVNNTNVRLVPNDITKGKWIDDGTAQGKDIEGNKYVNEHFIGYYDNIIQKYDDSDNTLFTLLVTQLDDYFNKYSDENKYQVYEDRKFVFGHAPARTMIVHELTSGINVRNFYDDFVHNFYKSIIDVIKNSTGEVKQSLEDFIGNGNLSEDEMFISKDFTKLIEEIYKDLSYAIRLNMMDSHGNVEEEYTDGRKVRGGYSLGSEIVRIDLSELSFTYK